MPYPCSTCIYTIVDGLFVSTKEHHRQKKPNKCIHEYILALRNISAYI